MMEEFAIEFGLEKFKIYKLEEFFLELGKVWKDDLIMKRNKTFNLANAVIINMV